VRRRREEEVVVRGDARLISDALVALMIDGHTHVEDTSVSGCRIKERGEGEGGGGKGREIQIG